MSSIARLAAACDGEAMVTLPSFSISISAPVSSWIERMVLPPGPMTSRILSGGTMMVMRRGACWEMSPRGASIAACILPEDLEPSGLGLLQRLAHDLARDALDLDVHLQRGDAVARCRRP